MSIVVSCVPILRPAVQLIVEKFKAFRSSHQSTKQAHVSSRDQRNSAPIPLRALPDLREETPSEYSVAAAPDTYKSRQGSYESLRSLVSGIRRTTEVDIQNSVV